MSAQAEPAHDKSIVVIRGSDVSEVKQIPEAVQQGTDVSEVKQIPKAVQQGTGKHLRFVGSTTGGIRIISESPLSRIDPELEREFSDLVRQWRKETRHVSSIHERSMNRSYQKIIALGQAVMPLILRDLERTRDHWLWALDIIQDSNPAAHARDFDEAVEAWLLWGRRVGYLG